MRKIVVLTTLTMMMGATALDAKTVTRNTAVTRADGKMATGSLTRNIDRAGGTYDSHRTQTGFNGKTRTVDSQATRTAPGVWEGSRTVTKPNGETRTAAGTRTVTRGN